MRRPPRPIAGSDPGLALAVLFWCLFLLPSASHAFVTVGQCSRRSWSWSPPARLIVLMNDRSGVPLKKAEAFELASQDKGAPAVVLVRPYLDENIGSCARAMLNFGLWDLRIVNPFCDHLTDMARARASGAAAILENARVFEDIGSAVEDLAEVVGTSARQRDMTIRVVSPEQAGGMAIRSMESFMAGGARLGLMFGSERNGLTNEDLVFASALLQIPTNKAFSSLNLGQAVQIVGYEYWKARAKLGDATAPGYRDEWTGVAKGTRLATVGEVEGLWRRLEEVLDLTELNPDGNIRRLLYARMKNILVRAEADVRDVNALHGALTSVITKHENLEGVKQRLLKANEGHGTKRRGGRKVRAGTTTTAAAQSRHEAREWREGGEEFEDRVDAESRAEARVLGEEDEEGVGRANDEEAIEAERRSQEMGW